MKAVPMRDRLTGKKIAGYIWAGTGKNWQKKENYFQLESNKLISAQFATAAGWFTVRCKGSTLRIKLHGPKGKVVGSAILALPGGRKR